MNHRVHLLALAVASGMVAALVAIVAANGFRDFGSALWLFDAATVAALGYVLTILVVRAVSRKAGAWKRASLFGAVAGGVLGLLAFVRLAALNASGVSVAVVLASALGVALGLAAVEGLRWVLGDTTSSSRAV